MMASVKTIVIYTTHLLFRKENYSVQFNLKAQAKKYLETARTIKNCI